MPAQRKHAEVMTTATMRMLATDWAELAEVYGTDRSEVVRMLIAAELRRLHRGGAPKQPATAASQPRDAGRQ